MTLLPNLRRYAHLGLVPTCVTAAVLVPSTAQAVENVTSYYRVGCTIHPDDATTSSPEPAGLSYDGDRNDVTVSPAMHLLSGSTVAPQPADASGEDCDVNAGYSDQLTVGAGTSGLAVGQTVEVAVAVRLDAALAQTWGDDGDFNTIAEYRARVSVTSIDDCTFEEEFYACDTPVDFDDRHYHQVYGTGTGSSDPNGYVEADAYRESRFATNAGTLVEEYVDEDGLLCDAYPCASRQVHPDAGPEVFSGTATLVVGDRYAIEGVLSVLASAYGNVDELASAAVDGFSLEILTSSGVDLSYASEGVTDTVPPTILGAEDVTVESANGVDAVVVYDVTAEDDSGGPVSVTCEPPSGSTFPVGETAVSCEAVDGAGNTATAQFTVTVSAPDPLQVLGEAVDEVAVPQGIGTALRSKYDAALAAFLAGDAATGCAALADLAAFVSAQAGKKIASTDAAVLADLTSRAQSANGC